MRRREPIFCVGSTGSGKTILLKNLERKEEEGDCDWHELVSSTIPTVGINHFEIGGSKCGISGEVNVKELGGELAQNWGLYLKQQCSRARRVDLIYVIDLSNPSLVAEVTFHLLSCLRLLSVGGGSGGEARMSSILVVYSKVDEVRGNAEAELRRFRSLLRLEELRRRYRDTAQFEEVSYSFFEDEGVVQIKDWIRRRASKST